MPKLKGSELKLFLLEKSIDKESMTRISVRRFLQLYGKEIGIGITPNSFTYWAKKLAKFKPYEGRKIDDKLIWEYGVDNGLIDPSYMPYEEFKITLNKQRAGMGDVRVFKSIIKELDEKWDENEFTLAEMKQYIQDMYGEDIYSKLYNKYKKIK